MQIVPAWIHFYARLAERPHGIKRRLLLAGCCFWMVSETAYAAPAIECADFSLTHMDGGKSVQLADYVGGIVVLDFFSHWCVPCRNSSPVIHEGIETYYRKTGGNSHGIDVSLIAVSIDNDAPEKVLTFAQEAGLSVVVSDHDGALLKQYGGESIPYIVIIDASQKTPEIVYAASGFAGIDVLRGIIDRIGAPAANGSAEAPVKGSAEKQNLFSRETPQDISPNAAFLQSSDIFLMDSGVEYNLRGDTYQTKLIVQQGRIKLDFVPSTTVLDKNTRDEKRYTFQASEKIQLTDALHFTLAGSSYKGFMDYKSVWLDEYYRQLFEGVDGYKKADPKGWAAGADLRWEYLPGTGFLQGTVSFMDDTVSPFYERDISSFPPLLVRGNDHIQTLGGGISLENVLSRRLRTLQEFQVQDTTDRDLRYAAKSSFNLAVTEHVVWRAEAAGTRENPDFQAWSIANVLEYDWDSQWFLSLSGRYYEDTGQIEASLPGNSSAPAVQTSQLTAGVRRQGVRTSFKLTAGPYFSRYKEKPADLEFKNLYQNRDWLFVDAVFTFRF